MYQLIIFDWDGTLMDSAQKISACLCAAAVEVGLPAPAQSVAKRVIGLGLHEAMQRLFPAQADPVYRALIDAYRHQFVMADHTEQTLFEGVYDGLQQLEQQGALLAVATGKSRRGLERAFAVTNVDQHFVATRCADETRSKPHPQMLHEILNFTAIAPEKAIMVGDTSFDMEMAVNARVPGLGVAYGVHPEPELEQAGAQIILNSFNEVVNWLLDGRIEPAFSA